MHHQEKESIGMKVFHKIEDVAKMDFDDNKKRNVEASSQGLDEPQSKVKNTDTSCHERHQSTYVSWDGGGDDNRSEPPTYIGSEDQCQSSSFSLADNISRRSQCALKFEDSLSQKSQNSYNKEGSPHLMDSFTKGYRYQRRLLSVAEREKPLIAANCFTSSRPFVTRLMKESHVYRGFWMVRFFPSG